MAIHSAPYIRRAILYTLTLLYISKWVYTSKDEKRLLQDLFRNYDKAVRPVRQDNHTVTVKVKHTVSQILDVNERKELFKTSGWSSLRWRDAYLAWSPEKYNGIRSINISPEKLWLPDILLYDDIESDKSFGTHVDQVQNRLTINYYGNVVWGLKATFVTKCHFDIYYFPFDVQTCPLRYGSWSYEKGRIDISEDSKMQIDQHAEHNGWHVLSHSTQILRKTYSDVTYESSEFSITFKRRASLGSVNLILPPLIINVLVLLSFVLPAASGERLALSITLLLALIFFLLNVTFLVPKDNATIPIIYKFFIATLTQTVLLIVSLIVGMQLYHKTSYDRPMSKWVRTIFLDRLAYCLGTRADQSEVRSSKEHPMKIEDVESIIEVGFLPYEHSNIRTFESNTFENTIFDAHSSYPLSSKLYHSKQLILKEWRIVALTMDRCFFIFFSLMWVLTLFTFFVKFFYTNDMIGMEHQ